MNATAGDPTSSATFTRLAAIAYPLAWLVGLSLVSSSTSVTTSGASVLQEFGSHRKALALQSILTQGIAPAALLCVLQSFQRVATAGARLARVTRISGTLGATISFVQCLAGLWLATVVVQVQDAHMAGVLKDFINRVDGLKMFAFAAMALAGTLLLRRRRAAATWLQLVGLALAVAIVVSGVGYLLLDPFLANAAWLSLPLLLVWVAGVGVTLSRVRGN